MTKPHTPGPWHVGQGNGEGSVFADEGRMRYENGTVLYPICSVIDMDGEGEANGNLIAAAPELLQCLRDCVTAYEQHRDNTETGHLWPDPRHIHYARRAINKAEGVTP